MTEPGLPRFYANNLNVAVGPYDATLTFLEHDGTALPPDQEGPHRATQQAVVQVVLSLGALKATLPVLVRVVADYEQTFGSIAAPGFDEGQKE